MRNLSAEVLEGIRAHNGRRPDACYNDNWNKAYKTGSIRARYLCTAALTSKHGICCGSMKIRRVTKQIIHDYLIGHASAEMKAWAYQAENGYQCNHCGHQVGTEKPAICPGCDAGDPCSIFRAEWIPGGAR